MKRYVSLKELAEMFAVSERHIFRQLAKRAFPPPVRIGRCKRWDPEDVRRFLERNDGKCGQTKR